MWYPGRSARDARKSNRGDKRKAALNAQKSAEAIVPQKNEGRAEPIQPGVTGGRKTAWKRQNTLGTAAARKEIARNAKGMRERRVPFDRKTEKGQA